MQSIPVLPQSCLSLDVGRSVDLARSNSVSDVLGNSWVFDGRKYLFPIFTSLNITIYRVFTDTHEFLNI